MFGLGAGEIAIIGLLALIFIGPKKLPDLARSLGRGFREFQRAKDDIMNDVYKKEPPLLEEAKESKKDTDS
ncbi:MAG: twin-arginine translocase TatA/TatE family subunit [Halobacteriovoraceae bacterium]|nr:twin-arginine translocase TatA/TatE family subunit [Halobacteriovoraceae bacterium]